jgi:hypothetical protein
MITLELTKEEANRLLDCIILPTVARKLADAINAPALFVLKYEIDDGYKCSCCRTSSEHRQSFGDIDELCAFVVEQELASDGDFGFSLRDIVLERPERSVFSDHRNILENTRSEMKRRLDLQVKILVTQDEIRNADASLANMRSEFEAMKPKLNAAGIEEYERDLCAAQEALHQKKSVLAQMTPPNLSKQLAALAGKTANAMVCQLALASQSARTKRQKSIKLLVT